MLGLHTLRRRVNDGSYWQARCLIEGLRNCGLNTITLDEFRVPLPALVGKPYLAGRRIPHAGARMLPRMLEHLQ